MMLPLTAKQNQLLHYLRAQKTGPSFEEMKVALNLKSKSRVHALVTALEERGFVRRLPNRPRAIELVPEECRRTGGLSQFTLGELLDEVNRRLQKAGASLEIAA